MPPFDDKMRPVFMISVAAELAEMHPQTLRMYERRGLIRPQRSSKSTRLYSLDDVERLRRIQQLVTECGLNLAGVERVLQMEQQVATLRQRLDELQADMEPSVRAGSRRTRGGAPQLPQGTGTVRQSGRGDTRGPAAPRPPMSEEKPLGGDEPGDEPVEGGISPAREQPCANHPGRTTMVTCSACGKPLCPDCMVFSAVGIKCRECAKMPRSALVTLKGGRLLRAVAAGLAAGTAVGFAYYYILAAIGFFFFFFFVAAGIGYLVGEAVFRASGYYHGLQTAVVAALSTVWAFVFPPVIAVFLSTGFSWDAVVFSLSSRGLINWVIMALAGYLAWRRNR